MTKVLRQLLSVAATASVLGAAVAVAAPVATAAPSACTDVNVVVARGTGEAGSLGVRVGDPFYAAIKKAAPGKTFSSYRVDYPASLFGNSPGLGNTDTVEHVEAQAAACPNQKFVLVGYSQGANVIGNSIGTSSEGALVGGAITATISAKVEPRVAAVALFGYPNGKRRITITGTYAARTSDICAPNDIICSPFGFSTQAHRSYATSGLVDKAATVAAGRL